MVCTWVFWVSVGIFCINNIGCTETYPYQYGHTKSWALSIKECQSLICYCMTTCVDMFIFQHHCQDARPLTFILTFDLCLSLHWSIVEQTVNYRSLTYVVYVLVCFPVFQESPKLPPSQAQAQARSISADEYSYTASVLRLLQNKNFMLLVVSYGGSHPFLMTDRVNKYIWTLRINH